MHAMRRSRFIFPAVLCLVLTISLRAEEEHAQEQAMGGAPFASRTFFGQIRYTPSALFRGDFDQADGSIAVLHHDVSGTLVIALPPRGRLNLAVSRDWHRYRIRDTGVIDGLLDEAYSIQFAAVYMGRLTDEWGLFALASVGSSYEQGASRSDGQAEAATVLFQYQWTDNLQVGLGGFVSSRMDESYLIIPGATINWDITDRWNFRTMRGLHLSYAFDPQRHWRIALNNEYISRYFRLREDGPGAGGVFRSRGIVSTLALLYQPNPGIMMGAEVGYSPWRNIRVRDRDDQTVFESRVRDSLSAAFTASITF